MKSRERTGRVDNKRYSNIFEFESISNEACQSWYFRHLTALIEVQGLFVHKSDLWWWVIILIQNLNTIQDILEDIHLANMY